MDNLTLSPLGHTWFLDLDGTLVRHNGYKIDGYDTLLDGAMEFLRQIPDGDMLIIVTSRTEENRLQTETFLKNNNIKYHHIIFGAPYGERIVVNDRKPGGLDTSVAVNLKRDEMSNMVITINNEL